MENNLHLWVLRDLCGFPFIPAEPMVERHYADSALPGHSAVVGT
ncbi:MAG: hypothetical protein PHV74_11590 [Dehalococcoidia bacterium]|nr:hypothetical protein [Dehalococcoidia bacterium]